MAHTACAAYAAQHIKLYDCVAQSSVSTTVHGVLCSVNRGCGGYLCILSVALGDWKQMDRRVIRFFLLAEVRLSSMCGLVENDSST